MKKLIAVFAILMMAATVQAATLSPMPRLYFRNSAGTQPLSNGKVYTYSPGTSSPKATYTDSTATVEKTNPFSLDADGGATFFLSGCYDISVTTSAGVPLYSTTNICEYAEATASSALTPQWNASGITPVFTGTTSFSTSGDYTDVFTPGLRLKSTTTAGTIYSTVVSAVYAATVTTVTVVNDSGVLDSGLSEVQISVLTVANPSMPIVPVATKTTGYTILPTDCGKILGANLSSAATFTFPAASTVPSGCTIVTRNTSTWSLTISRSPSSSIYSVVGAELFSNGSLWMMKTPGLVDDTGTLRTASTVTAPNVIPVTGADGKLAPGFIPSFILSSGTYTAGQGTVLVTSATTTIFTIDLGTATENDVFYSDIWGQLTKGATAGVSTTYLTKSSGTATVVYNYNSTFMPCLYEEIEIGGVRQFSCGGMFRVTGSGSLVMKVNATSAGSDSTGPISGAFYWLYKQ